MWEKEVVNKIAKYTCYLDDIRYHKITLTEFDKDCYKIKFYHNSDLPLFKECIFDISLEDAQELSVRIVRGFIAAQLQETYLSLDVIDDFINGKFKKIKEYEFLFYDFLEFEDHTRITIAKDGILTNTKKAVKYIKEYSDITVTEYNHFILNPGFNINDFKKYMQANGFILRHCKSLHELLYRKSTSFTMHNIIESIDE